jgi:dTDP-D-glucose 4,6-dehydratase
MYIDDCVEGSIRILQSECREPLNLGSNELVSINQMVSMVEDIAGIKLKRRYQLDAPQGVRGRNSDNTKILSEIGWAPSVSLQAGLEKTYAWIYDQLKKPEGERRSAFFAKADARYDAVAGSNPQALTDLPKSIPPLGLFKDPAQAKRFTGA